MQDTKLSSPLNINNVYNTKSKIVIKCNKWFFLHGEGPRSRCYGRTTALRLFVQPYDDDEQFFTKFYK
jgi:hypothetical protein